MKKSILLLILPLLSICSCANNLSSSSDVPSSSSPQSSSTYTPTITFKDYEVITIQPFFSRMNDIEEEPNKGWVLPSGVNNFNLLLNSAGNYLKTNNSHIKYEETNYIKDEVLRGPHFSKLGKNQIILFEGHGSFASIPGDPEMHSVMWTGQNYDESLKDKDDDYKNDRLIQVGGFFENQEALNYLFIEKYVGDITGSIVYLGNCFSARDCTWAQAFLKKGALAVIGNSHTTQSAYNGLMEYTTIKSLIDTNPNTGKPYTLHEAFMHAKELYGKTDQARNPSSVADASEPILYGDPNFCLYTID